MDAAIMNAQDKKILEALGNAENASQAAQRAIDDRDLAAVRSLVAEALGHTCDVLGLATRAGKLDLVQNLMPSAVYYAEVLTALEASPFDAIAKLTAAASIGAVPPRSKAEAFLDLFVELVSKGGL